MSACRHGDAGAAGPQWRPQCLAGAAGETLPRQFCRGGVRPYVVVGGVVRVLRGARVVVLRVVVRAVVVRLAEVRARADVADLVARFHPRGGAFFGPAEDAAPAPPEQPDPQSAPPNSS